jgi:hypothetical protein
MVLDAIILETHDEEAEGRNAELETEYQKLASDLVLFLKQCKGLATAKVF